MKVNCQNNRDISFNGFYNNKAFKKGLEFAANNGTLFAATTTLVLSGIRPLAILSTPNTSKKNKQVACAKSVTSSINGYLIALACSYPLSRSIKKIDKMPNNYLKPETIKNLKDAGKALTESKAYSMATQLFKLGLGAIIAAPKAILTALGTPYVLKFFDNKEVLNNEPSKPIGIGNNLSFRAKNNLPSNIGKIINKKGVQDFVVKHKDSNFPMHIVAVTDTLSTATFVHQINSNKHLEEQDKKPLIYNSIISTALSISSTYILDHLTKNKTDEFIEKFKKIKK